MFRRLFRSWFGAGQDTESPGLQPRLREDEVLAIAGKAVGGDPIDEHFCVEELEEGSGALIWSVGSATVGSGLYVRVDDATGRVVEIKRWGVR